ncbi:MAG: MMPL family transporter [Bacteroidaceae bacterium]|nr:MMPL family transporter [Bacteroidaceae bacterium]
MVLKMFDFFRRHAFIRWASLVGVTMMMMASVMRLSYKEDILDFLPLDETDRQRMAIYEDISGMNRLFVIFENVGGTEATIEMVERFAEVVEEADTAGLCQSMRTSFDSESISEAMDFIVAKAPLLLTAADYKRMDSLLSKPGYIEAKLEEDLNTLMFPSGGWAEQHIGRDPLGLFAPLLEEFGKTEGSSHFEMYDGYIFTSDMQQAIVMLTSPFGSSETAGNARLVDLLEQSIEKTKADFPDMKAHVAGGPQIAVTSARQIMRDSMLALSLSAVLIIALLLYAFRRFRYILLIALTVLWGWLFALGALAFVHSNVSMIVVGISSIIIGIAVNYPLHLISHLQHQPDIRETLSDITKPLLVGNITTVAAFLALVPLKSTCLRDLGLFASFLLIGTILFVLVWLPHKASPASPQTASPQPSPVGEGVLPLGGDRGGSFPFSTFNFQFSASKVLVLIALLTLVFGYFSLSVEFDSDLSNINYLTDEQKSDMNKAFGEGRGEASLKGTVTLYLLSSGRDFDEALALSESKQAVIDSLEEAGMVANHRGISRFLPSKKKQQEHLKLWNEWLERHPHLLSDLKSAATKQGFAEDAFSDFENIILSEHAIASFSDFQPLTSEVFANNISRAAKGKSTIAETLTIREDDAKRVKEVLPEAFDIGSLHSSLADALSSDFNYVGWVCSLVVFLFLWLSFRSIKLAVISFIPMAVSWIWILGIMSLLGIKFNIVNIILATFIFGQGDDYTIFITEGCISEYVHGKPVLASYKRSIILSALIMFIGIGTLITSRHPALHSLAEVTIVGMFSVVLMAYIIPPILVRKLKIEKDPLPPFRGNISLSHEKGRKGK